MDNISKEEYRAKLISIQALVYQTKYALENMNLNLVQMYLQMIEDSTKILEGKENNATTNRSKSY